jgi:hypothetical protein
LLLIGALFVGVIFLTSYASFGNNSVVSSTTTTVANVRTVPAFGSSTATVTGYSTTAYVRVNASFSTAGNTVAETLSKLEANGSIISYLPSSASGYEVYLQAVNSSSINAYSLQGLLRSAVNRSNAITITAVAYVELPSNITLYYNMQPIPVPVVNRGYSVNMTDLDSLGSKLNVSVSALITSNGSVYRNQLVVVPKK